MLLSETAWVTIWNLKNKQTKQTAAQTIRDAGIWDLVILRPANNAKKRNIWWPDSIVLRIQILLNRETFSSQKTIFFPSAISGELHQCFSSLGSNVSFLAWEAELLNFELSMIIWLICSKRYWFSYGNSLCLSSVFLTDLSKDPQEYSDGVQFSSLKRGLENGQDDVMKNDRKSRQARHKLKMVIEQILSLI